MNTYLSGQRPSLTSFFLPWRIVSSLALHRNLIIQFTRREVEKRYRGTVLGIFWSFLTPLIMLGVYTLVFGFIFGGSYGHQGETKTQFALGLFCSLLLWEFIGSAIAESPALIVSNPNYVSKVIFPLEILPVCSIASSFIHMLIGFLPLFIFILIEQGGIPLTAIELVPIMVPVVLYCIGICWTLSALGVFLRDIASLVTPATTILMFMSALFFPLSAIPKAIRWIVELNPAAILISMGRNALVFGQSPDWALLGIQTIVSISVAIIGYALFIKSKPAFADVL
jgi:lipopolysaccharide transport system permease protein